MPDFRTRILGDWACPVSNWCTFYSNSWGAVEYWPNDHQTMLLNFFTPHHSLLLYSAFFYNPRVSWIVNLSDSNRNRCIGSRISFIYSIRLRDPPQSFVLLSFLLFFFGHALAVSFGCFLFVFFLVVSSGSIGCLQSSASLALFGQLQWQMMTDDCAEFL